MPSDAKALLEQFERLINKLVFLEKRYVFRQGDLWLHPSELHVLLAVRSAPAANATRLAARLGVTKGAVSQVLKRLEGKGVIVKHVDASQKNEVTVSFTPTGREAIEAFLGQRAALHREFVGYLESLPPAERETLRLFVDRFAAFLPDGE